MPTFAEQLRAARKLRGMTQRDLAEATGQGRSAVARYELSTRSPSSANLATLAEALRVSTDFLLGRTNEPEGQPGHLSEVQRRWMALDVSDQKSMWDLLCSMEPL